MRPNQIKIPYYFYSVVGRARWFQNYGEVDVIGYNNTLYAHEINIGVAFKF